MQEEQGQALPLERDGPRRCQAPDAGAKIKPPDESAKPTRTARVSESERNLGTNYSEYPEATIPNEAPPVSAGRQQVRRRRRIDDDDDDETKTTTIAGIEAIPLRINGET